MADGWVQFAVSNLCVSGALALVAWVVHDRGRQPMLAHVLWLLVLVKLVTPPVFTLPLIPFEHPAVADFARVTELGEFSATAAATDAREPHAAPPPGTDRTSLASALSWTWILGSLVVAAWSLTRIARFHRLLGRVTRPASASVRRLAQTLADEIGLRRPPAIEQSPASIAPFVWWLGGHPRVVLPEAVVDRLPREQLRMVLAHELVHVQRRDHWVRWIEWFACVAFWWNPITWWARGRLRAVEELACDVMVLDRLNPDQHDYANSLLTVAEFLSPEATRPPAVASAMDSGGNLEQRLTMIISKHLPTTPRWLLSAAVTLGVGVLPLSVAYAQDFKAVERRLGGAVEAGELTLDQARDMMDALRKSTASRKRAGLEKRYAEAERRLKIAVADGEISATDAKKRMAAYRDDLFGETRDSADAKRRYAGIERRVKAAVESGDLTAADAKKKLAAARDDLADPGGQKRRVADRKRVYGMLEERVKAAVLRGDLSYEDAETKLDEARKGMSDEQLRGLETRLRYGAYEQRIKAAVERGDLSYEDAEQKLAAARKKISAARDDGRTEMEARSRRDAELKRKLEAAVESGDLSKEDAKKKFAEIRKKTSGNAYEKRPTTSGKTDEKRPTKSELRKRYDELQRNVKQAVESGEISIEDAQRKLIEARKKTYDVSENEKDGARPSSQRRIR